MRVLIVRNPELPYATYETSSLCFQSPLTYPPPLPPILSLFFSPPSLLAPLEAGAGDRLTDYS